MFVCSCRAITERQVVAAALAGARTVDDIDTRFRAERECGGCTPLIEEVLRRALADALAASSS